MARLFAVVAGHDIFAVQPQPSNALNVFIEGTCSQTTRQLVPTGTATHEFQYDMLRVFPLLEKKRKG